MYGNQNAINPIITFPDLGGAFVIWGQKTLQRSPTALDRVNVRRMLFYIEKQIKSVAKRLIFEPNTEATRNTFVLLASSILDNVKALQGVYDYFVKCDSELNTPDVIDRNELRARIGVQPTRAIEFVFIEFSLHKTGSFTENTDY
jgi:phage tail sheath protein FI